MLPIKITIDTKEDSHEDIKKVIGMLSQLVGHDKIYANKNIFDSSHPEVIPSEGPGSIFGNIFDNVPTNTPINNKSEQSETEKKPPQIEIIDY